MPADPATYRYDRLVDDVDALRVHLGRDRIDLLGHSAGGSLAVLYAARHPDRVARLALVNPSPRPVGLDITDLNRREVAELRRGEPWFPEAFAAFERIWSGAPTAEDWAAITPFMHGRWDAARRAQLAREEAGRNPEAAAGYYAAGGPDPAATRSSLTRLEAPVLLLTGEYGSPRSAPPSTPACSRRPNWPCSRAPDTTPGSMTRSRSGRPWPRSCADGSAGRPEDR